MWFFAQKQMVKEEANAYKLPSVKDLRGRFEQAHGQKNVAQSRDGGPAERAMNKAGNSHQQQKPGTLSPIAKKIEAAKMNKANQQRRNQDGTSGAIVQETKKTEVGPSSPSPGSGQLYQHDKNKVLIPIFGTNLSVVIGVLSELFYSGLTMK